MHPDEPGRRPATPASGKDPARGLGRTAGSAGGPDTVADVRREYERRVAQIEAVAHVGSWEWDIAADTITWSPELYRIFGVDPEGFEATYDAYLRSVHPDDRALVDGHVKRAFAGGDAFSFEHRIVRPDDTVRWIYSAGRVEKAAGTVVRMMGIARDMTQQRLASGRFETLLEAAPDAMILVDRAGTIKFVNVQAEALFGYGREEIMGQRVEVLVPEALRAMHVEHRASFHDAPRRRPMGADLDLRARRKDGAEVPVEISLSPIDTPEGPMVLAAVRDVSDRMRARQREKQARDRVAEVEKLRTMNDFKTQLLNTAAHELNTPLTPLRLQLHLLTSGTLGDMTDRQKHAVTVLDRNVKRLSDLVADILDVARLESGRLKVAPEPTALARIVDESVESFAETARRVGVGMRVDVPDDLVVEADPSRLTQVLYNLITNALKFTADGGVVTVSAAVRDGEAAVAVRDTGIGMTSDQMARLFQPFSQVHEHIRHGTGLGLYICRGIVQQHGGQIDVHSDGPGRGSVFTFTLPRSSASIAVPKRVPPSVTPDLAPDRLAPAATSQIAQRLRELI